MDMTGINLRWPVTNVMWRRIDMTMSQYLCSLKVAFGNNLSFSMYEGITGFYLRTVYDKNYGTNVASYEFKTKLTDKMEMDPWDRKFKCFPATINQLQRLHIDDRYRFRGYYYNNSNIDIKSGYNCYVISTTICGEVVYCVDVFR